MDDNTTGLTNAGLNEKIENLSAEVLVLRELVKALIGFVPYSPEGTTPITAAVRRVNQANPGNAAVARALAAIDPVGSLPKR